MTDETGQGYWKHLLLPNTQPIQQAALCQSISHLSHTLCLQSGFFLTQIQPVLNKLSSNSFSLRHQYLLSQIILISQLIYLLQPLFILYIWGEGKSAPVSAHRP